MTLTVKGGTVVKGPLRVGSWLPTDISGCQLWLDAADNASVVRASGVVSQWSDKSGAGRSVSQSNASYRPTYTNTQNGLPVITFASASTQYLDNSSAAILRNVTGWTQFCVLKPSSYPSTQPIFLFVGESGNSVAAMALTGTNGYAQSRARRLVGDSVSALTDTVAFGTSAYKVMTSVGDYSTTTGSVYLNGVSVATSSSWCSSGATSSNSGGALQVGALSTGTNWFNGSIAEILVYNTALSTANRQAVEAYLKTKWGIA